MSQALVATPIADGGVDLEPRVHTPEGEAAMCRYLKDREHSAWAAGWLAEMGTTSSILPLMRARRWHPFDRDTYTAAIRAIERRHAEQTT